MGWAWVVGLHALLFGALQAGLDRTVVQNMPTVVQALLLEDRRTEVRSEPRPEPAKPVPPPLLKPETPPVKTPPQSPAPTVVEPAVVAQANANAIAAASPPPAPANTSAPASPAATAVAAPKPAAPARTTANVNMAQCEKPEYPSASRRMEEEGTVALRFLVGVDGKIVQSEIEKSSGYKRLDEAARTGLSKCQFKPATVDGKPEQAWTTIRYVWRLD
jgi:protein TonB